MNDFKAYMKLGSRIFSINENRLRKDTKISVHSYRIVPVNDIFFQPKCERAN